MDSLITQEDTLISRRPIAARAFSWAQNSAKCLNRLGMSANQVSIAGLGFALIGAGLIISILFVPAPWRIVCWLTAACTIVLRLLCNMLDGLIAIEGKKQSKLGILFNEFPDRIEDSILFIATGFACTIQPLGTSLGWFAALLAVSTAYVRAFGAQLGQGQDFCGPMAKPQRMWALAITFIAASLEEILYRSNYSPIIALFLICIGIMATCVRRTKHIAHQLIKSEK